MLRRLYSIYCVVIFALGFFILLPFFLLIIAIKPLRNYTGRLNNFWAYFSYFLCFIPIEIKYEKRFDKKGQYIFCPNHFSYFDIPVMGFTHNDFVFVGKHEITKVPIFGFMFRKLHVTVDRSSFRDRYGAMERSKEAIDRGHSLVVFPEGGIVTKNPPHMARFKDGAFRMAIEKQIPIIPVTIPYNWIILPDDDSFMIRRHKASITYHNPIETKGLSLEDIDDLKKQTFDVINKELRKYFPNES